MISSAREKSVIHVAAVSAAHVSAATLFAHIGLTGLGIAETV